MPINNGIINRLKTGSINNVVMFADSDKVPPPPYVVVKPEVGLIPGTRQFRIFVHMKQGFLDVLEKYIFKELEKLLINDESSGGKVFITDADGTYRLQPGGYTDLYTEISDNTIVMERIFFMPFRSGGTV